MNKFEELTKLVDEIRESGKGIDGNAIVILERDDNGSELMFNLDGERMKTHVFIVSAVSRLFTAVLDELIESGFPPELATKILYDAITETYRRSKGE